MGELSARMLAAIRARPMARVALRVLALLYTLAIFAPFLAGDRPLYVGEERRFPVLEELSAFEILLMVLWTAVLVVPRLRRRPRGLVALAVLGALAAALAFGSQRSAFATSDWKDRIASGEVSADAVYFPPIRMGFAETNLGEAYRPPTWLASSEISEEGHYVRGPRAPVEEPADAFRPEPTPVEVRPFEPARNSPWRHPLGTDTLGRDLLVRLLYGARTSLSVGLLSAAALFAIGVLVGALAGWFRGPIDLLLSRGIEVVLCFPAFFLVLFVLSVSDPEVLPPVLSIALVIALVGWPSVARLVRAEVLRLREADFVLAARALGCSPARTILAHVLPNAVGPAIVAASFAVGTGALVEAALSYLGLGVQSPIPSWGSIVNESHAAAHWWIQLFPGLAILVSVVCYNFVGEALREGLDPRVSGEERTR
ncbi:MAG: ABC transporter permease [Planctomycetota bacterium]